MPGQLMRESSEHLLAKIAEAHAILDEALATQFEGRAHVATAILYSGGNDSTTLAHLMRGRATHAIHARTGIGIPQTYDFVVQMCTLWGLPLITKDPPVPYRQLVKEHGFPGPAHHWKMYQRLKERCLDAARHDLIANPFKERAVFLAGRRRAESQRRKDVPAIERDGSVVWVSPFVDWTDEDLAEYRETYDVPKNPVSEKLGMSGECLCGAFADPGEYHDIAHHFPETAAEISALQDEVRAVWAEHVEIIGEAPYDEARCKWGWGAYRADPEAQSAQDVRTGPMCSSCDARRAPEARLAAMFRGES